MEPYWISKRDPKLHPVRFLAGIWEKKTGTPLTPKEFGQLRDLEKFLGEFAPDVIEWVLDKVNWWHFCQQVRAEAHLPSAPPYAHIGFLLSHREKALKIMRSALEESSAPRSVEFCTKLDRRRYEQLKTLALVYANGKAEWLAKIGDTATLADMQRVFIELVDASHGCTDKESVEAL